MTMNCYTTTTNRGIILKKLNRVRDYSMWGVRGNKLLANDYLIGCFEVDVLLRKLNQILHLAL